jgi:DNA modification methylase
MKTPFYSDEFVTIYHGDAKEILPTLSSGFVLVTDPPYGVNLGKTIGRGGKHGLARLGYDGIDDSYESWSEAVLPIIFESVKRAKRAAVFTGPHIQEQPKASAIGGIYNPAGSGRHRWGFNTFSPVLFYGTAPNLHKGAKPNTLKSSARAERNGHHPCPKPLEWMSWLVNLASEENDTILDPFMGSGTTLRAAKDLSRRAIGIEINERYCEIAVRRLEAFAYA